MTQKEVADKLGISQSYISRLEKRIISRLQKEIKSWDEGLKHLIPHIGTHNFGGRST